MLFYAILVDFPSFTLAGRRDTMIFLLYNFFPFTKIRKIIHVDMDAFYASVEQRDDPELRGKPVAVGGGERRGVVAAASYEAREFGVRSAMSGVAARRACPRLIFVKPRFDVYKEVSRQIRQIFHEYTDLVEPLSLDEAYLDVTENKKGIPSGTLVAEQIRAKILEQTGLTASAGVSMNKFLAKVASDVNKPNGLTVIRPDQAEEFIDQLPIGKFYGIGRVTAGKMKSLGIHSGKDLKTWSRDALIERFGKAGALYHSIAWNIYDSQVNPHRVRKSLGAERTFSYDLASVDEMMKKVIEIAEEVERRMRKSQVKGRTLTLKVKFSDFQQITRSKTVANVLMTAEDILLPGEELLRGVDISGRKVRLLGLTVSGFDKDRSKNKKVHEKETLQLALRF